MCGKFPACSITPARGKAIVADDPNLICKCPDSQLRLSSKSKLARVSAAEAGPDLREGRGDLGGDQCRGGQPRPLPHGTRGKEEEEERTKEEQKQEK